MALIHCQGCNKEISDKATICIHCKTSFKTGCQVECPECKKVIWDTNQPCMFCGCPTKDLSIATEQYALPKTENRAPSSSENHPDQAVGIPPRQKSNIRPWTLALFLAGVGLGLCSVTPQRTLVYGPEEIQTAGESYKIGEYSFSRPTVQYREKTYKITDILGLPVFLGKQESHFAPPEKMFDIASVGIVPSVILIVLALCLNRRAT